MSVGGQVPSAATWLCMWRAPEPRAGSYLPLVPLLLQSSARGVTAASLQAAGARGYMEACQVRDTEAFINALYR